MNQPAATPEPTNPPRPLKDESGPTFCNTGSVSFGGATLNWTFVPTPLSVDVKLTQDDGTEVGSYTLDAATPTFDLSTPWGHVMTDAKLSFHAEVPSMDYTMANWAFNFPPETKSATILFE